MNDLIVREHAIQTFIDWQYKEFGYADLNRGERFIDAIELIPTAEPKEYVKVGTLNVQMPTIKEAKAIDKIVVYADTYKQEYFMPLSKVGRNTKAKTPTLFCCSVCGWECSDTIPCDTKTFNYCPNCGAKMKETEIPEYPCISCCDLMERAACCGCDKETKWQAKYGEE